MVLERVYICRHGFRLSWETQLWTSPTGIPRDPPLSAHGVDQAQELAGFLKAELGVESAADALDKGVVVLSSPLYRCVQTATPTAEALGVPIFVEPGLAEWYLPVRRGLHPALADATFLQKFFLLVAASSSSSAAGGAAAWAMLLTPPRTGESIRAVHARCATLVPALVSALEARGARTVVLFSHAATCIALSRAFANDLPPALLAHPSARPGEPEPLGEWRDEERLGVGAATCSVSKFVRTAGADTGADAPGEVWTREWDGRTDFMRRGEERRWDFTFVEEIAEDGLLDGKEVSATKSDNYRDLPTAAPKETVANERKEGRL
ncbi:hypothetical protein JCM3770_004063 [Rhodotorula araucariae]